jgi:hypothetical protein
MMVINEHNRCMADVALRKTLGRRLLAGVWLMLLYTAPIEPAEKRASALLTGDFSTIHVNLRGLLFVC